MYDIFEIGLDSSGLRQFTADPEAEDTEPIYLPDGRIAFMSSRDDRFVQCGDWALACGLYRMAADGSDPRRITEPKEGEFYPNMLADGRILYTHWDYVIKPYNAIQQLWAVNPYGRGAALLFGDHYAAPVGHDRDHAMPDRPNRVQHLVSTAFLQLLDHVAYVRVGDYQGEKLPLPPNATGSRRSRLTTLLKEGHHDVSLDLAEWRALAAWIDCNAPYYGGWDEIRLPEEAPGVIDAA